MKVGPPSCRAREKSPSPPYLQPLIARTDWPLPWPDLAEGRRRLDRLCRNGGVGLSSPGRSAHSSRAKKVLLDHQAPAGVRRQSPSALRSPSRPQRCGLGNGRRRSKMATIGTFKKIGTNEFTGEIVTCCRRGETSSSSCGAPPRSGRDRAARDADGPGAAAVVGRSIHRAERSGSSTSSPTAAIAFGTAWAARSGMFIPSTRTTCTSEMPMKPRI